MPNDQPPPTSALMLDISRRAFNMCQGRCKVTRIRHRHTHVQLRSASLTNLVLIHILFLIFLPFLLPLHLSPLLPRPPNHLPPTRDPLRTILHPRLRPTQVPILEQSAKSSIEVRLRLMFRGPQVPLLCGQAAGDGDGFSGRKGGRGVAGL